MKVLLINLFCFSFCFSNAQINQTEKIKGVNFVSPKFRSKLTGIDSISKVNANWIAICPFSYLYENTSKIVFNKESNWWGDSKNGLLQEIKKAKSCNLHVLVKPHFWLMNKGWAGDFDAKGNVKEEWETNYTNYMLYLAKLCDSMDVEMLSVGTELKEYTKKHPVFFVTLIKEIRNVYKGKLTYAANWDEYQTISFWNQLDYIGIDAYFPLSEKRTPVVTELELKWKTVAKAIREISTKYNKKVIFTEFGYRSIDYAANKQWEFESTLNTENVNFVAQQNAYLAFFNSIWNDVFLAGGFVWKWYDVALNTKNNSDYTPQNKPVLGIIKSNYLK